MATVVNAATGGVMRGGVEYRAGLVDADFGGGVIKQWIARKGAESPVAFAP
jgi:hypothetical protein